MTDDKTPEDIATEAEVLVELDEIEEVPELPTQEAPEPIRMTKEEMIAKGLLPPKKDAAIAKAVADVNSGNAQIEQIPVEQMLSKAQQPRQATTVNQDPLVKKAEVRGGMALDLIKVMVGDFKSAYEMEVDDIVKFAFALADAIQAEVDSGYQKDLVEETSKALRTS